MHNLRALEKVAAISHQVRSGGAGVPDPRSPQSYTPPPPSPYQSFPAADFPSSGGPASFCVSVREDAPHSRPRALAAARTLSRFPVTPQSYRGFPDLRVDRRGIAPYPHGIMTASPDIAPAGLALLDA